MRIISGKHRSRIIDMVGIESTRETSDKVRGAIFNLINGDIVDSICLDLFSGSGSMGLEALSRGAKFCYFNDINRKAFETTKKNYQNLKYSEEAKITNLDYRQALRQINRKCDIVFLDPPYALNCYYEIMSFLHQKELLAKGSLVICEAAKDVVIEIPNGFVLFKEKIYGIKKVMIFQVEGEKTDEI